MAAYNKFDSFVEALAKKVHNIAADQLMVALTNVAPVAGNSRLSDLTQIAYTNLSARVLTVASCAQTAGVLNAIINDLVLTSSGGPTGPFRYIVIYNNTATNKELISWFDYGSSITLADNETLTLDFPATAVVQIT